MSRTTSFLVLRSKKGSSTECRSFFTIKCWRKKHSVLVLSHKLSSPFNWTTRKLKTLCLCANTPVGFAHAFWHNEVDQRNLRSSGQVGVVVPFLAFYLKHSGSNPTKGTMCIGFSVPVDCVGFPWNNSLGFSSHI